MEKRKKDNKNNLILISANSSYVCIAQIKEGILSDFYLEDFSIPSQVGSIYKAQVTKKQAGLGACFVSMSEDISGFLYMRQDQKEAQKANKDVSIHLEALEKDLEKSDNLLKELKSGQMIMVQVIKDPLKGKNFRVTNKISLPGVYLVYLPNSPFHIGISKQIEKEEIKERLTRYVQKWESKGAIIVRTRAKQVCEEVLKADFEKLKKTWQDILKKYQSQKRSGLVWSDTPISSQVLRDVLTEEVKEVLVDDKELFIKLKDFVSKEIPKEKSKISLYKKGEIPLFNNYNLKERLSSLLNKTVSLDSGGFIIIEETEAAVIVDVNTGRFIGKESLEENILKINKEAAKEIAIQLRLRNCGGIILIDFIDMELESSRDQLMKLLADELKKDRVPTRLLPMSEFGIVQLTRKRSRASLLEKLSVSCSQCGNRSYLKKWRDILKL